MPSTISTAFDSFRWLLRFRWLAIIGQVAGLLFVERTQGIFVSWGWTSAALLLMAASNLGLLGLLRGSGVREQSLRWRHLLGGILVFDTAVLTSVFIVSGGPSNPFTVLYIVQIVLAALVLDAHWTGWVTVAGALGFGSLFFLGQRQLPARGHHGMGLASGHSYSQHLTGMWVAFACAALSIAYLVRRISKHQEEQRRQIDSLKERAMQAAHLTSLTTLAAGAAHELRTPLATIAVAAHELGRNLASSSQQRDRQDASLIGEEVERCQEILSALGQRFNQLASQAAWVDVRDVVEGVHASLLLRGQGSPAVRIHRADSPLMLQCVTEELEQAVRRLVDNALHALAAGGGELSLASAKRAGNIVIEVRDTGCGMSATTLTQAQNPFFTTKEPGQGMGLGLFLVQAYCLSLGGELKLTSVAGEGTCAALVLPLKSPEVF